MSKIRNRFYCARIPIFHGYNLDGKIVVWSIKFLYHMCDLLIVTTHTFEIFENIFENAHAFSTLPFQGRNYT